MHPYFKSINVQNTVACYMAKFWTNICDCNHWQLVQQAFSRIYHILRISQQDNLGRKVKFLDNINSDDITENCDPLRGKINMGLPRVKMWITFNQLYISRTAWEACRLFIYSVWNIFLFYKNSFILSATGICMSLSRKCTQGTATFTHIN